MMTSTDDEWDYVIVGSGAGGGTLAARLAEAGMRVFLLEAGDDARESQGERLPEDYDVPGFHAFACENAGMSWNFHVRHYGDEALQRRDWKYDADRHGVLYPRAATLGGCTAHNAMIFMLPHAADWNRIAELTGDRSWRASRMRRYAKRVEACHHRPLWRALRYLGLDITGHGWNGWLHTTKALPLEALEDRALLDTITGVARSLLHGLSLPLLSALRWLMRGHGDPNARPWRRHNFEGLCYTPLATRNGRRSGARERVLQVRTKHPLRLHVELNALATRVLFDADGNATGVEYLKGERQYRAHAAANPQRGVTRVVRAKHEVILCGGAFNTPQLLMLSGIGPAEQLRAHNIPLRVDSPGVGRNLQDRYEVALTYRMPRPWRVLEGARFCRDDVAWRTWRATGTGVYASNGALLGMVRRAGASDRAAPPDLFCMAMLTRFEGYFSGFSKLIGDSPDYLTWVVLKAHTQNRAGEVTLRSNDARDLPQVNFRYFEEGSDMAGEDLRAVVDGVKFVRDLNRSLIEQGVIAEEKTPGSAVTDDAALADYVRRTAWGHHASCTCAIGTVLDSNFKVRGVRRLRVVDAAVFPRIPGFFIVSAVYMIAEKAADAILRDAHYPLSRTRERGRNVLE